MPCVGVVILLEELSQYFLPSRAFDLIDLGADIAGILLFSITSYKH